MVIARPMLSHLFGNKYVRNEIHGKRFALLHRIVPEQGLSRQPNFILLHRFPGEKQQQQRSAHGQGGGPPSIQASAELPQSVHEEDTVAHAGEQSGRGRLTPGVPGSPPSTRSHITNFQIKLICDRETNTNSPVLHNIYMLVL